MPLPDLDAVMRVEAVEYARSRVVVQGMAQTVEVRLRRVDGAELRWFMVAHDAPRVGDIFTVTARAGDHAGEDDTVRDAVVQAIEELDAEHYPTWASDEAKSKGKEPVGCAICWPHDGSWPCASQMIASDLRDALTGAGYVIPPNVGMQTANADRHTR